MPKSAFSPAHRTVAETLVSARKEAGLLQSDVAERIGKDQPFVSNIETGLRRVDVLEFFALAQAIGVDPVELFAKLASRLPKKIEI